MKKILISFLGFFILINASLLLYILVLKPRPGSCLVLEEKYCNQGELIYNADKKAESAGFNLPENTPIFSPFDGFVEHIEASTNSEGQEDKTYLVAVHDREKEEESSKKSFTVVMSTPSKNKKSESLEPVKKGEIIARLSKGKLKFYIDNNLVVYFEKPTDGKDFYTFGEEELLKLFGK